VVGGVFDIDVSACCWRGFRECPNIVLASPILVVEDIRLNVLTLVVFLVVFLHCHLVVGDIQVNVHT